MSQSTSRNTLSRQWELLRLIPSKGPGITASELHQALSKSFNITKRTIERDLNALSLSFPLMCNDKGTPQGWYWMPDKTMDVPGVDLGEALSLMMVEQSLPTLMPQHLYKGLAPRFLQARNKLESLDEQNPTARWRNKVASVNPQLDMQPPALNAEVLERIQKALLQDVQISAEYFSVSKNETQHLTLSPLALVQRGLSLYLIATADHYQDPRQYVLHRFSKVALLKQPVTSAQDFNLKAYLESGALQFNPGEMIELHAWVDNTVAKLLAETPLSHDMQLTPVDDGFNLQANVRDSWQLEWWILQQGPSMHVTAPSALHQRIADKVKKMYARYCQ